VSVGKIDKVNAGDLRAGLGQCTIGREIIVLEETTSTNDAIWQRATPVTPEGLVIFAEQQTAGRGQRGNYWESIPGKGLWLSIFLRPKIALAQSTRLTAWAAQSVAETISQEFSLCPMVKPPNDIYLEKKKLAGVLVEMRAQKNAPHLAIAGIGINANHAREDFSEGLRQRAISLAQALDRHIDRAGFAIALLRKLDSTYHDLRGL
jgi:BirA family transcriptional regulator, biotin operon repressor / biotin---[acetyl-CoA-carboxylase] ligase